MKENSINPACSKAVGIAGAIGSGKTELAKALTTHLNCSTVSFGAFVKQEAKKRNIEPVRHNLQELGTQMIRELGSKKFTQLVLQTATFPCDIVILDGIRHIDVWKSVKNLIPRSWLVYIDIDEPTRLNRLLKRDGLSLSETESHNMEIVAKALKQEADVILTSTDIEASVLEIKNIINEV